jgi:hypothetical protein
MHKAPVIVFLVVLPVLKNCVILNLSLSFKNVLVVTSHLFLSSYELYAEFL